MRNLDMTALRSFVAVADRGSVTNAAASVNLTQSAVSMQMKRLEEMLGVKLIDRAGRGCELTPTGQLLLSYARRLVETNDEAVGRLTDDLYEGEIVLGVPYDIVYPVVPEVLKQFGALYPRVKVQLKSSSTTKLLAALGAGKVDLILTTEERAGPGGETLTGMPLRWCGAIGGRAWQGRPLKVAFCNVCIFRKGVLERLDAAGIEWEMAVDSDDDRSVEALIAADLAVGTLLEPSVPPQLEIISAGGALPKLQAHLVNMYRADDRDGPLAHLADMLRQQYASGRAAEASAA